MTKDETLKMALDFLMTRRMGAEAVIEALNEALAQPPLPVQPERQPLTDEHIDQIAHNVEPEDWNSLYYRGSWHNGFHAGFREAETEHRSQAMNDRNERYPPKYKDPLYTTPPLPVQEQQQAEPPKLRRGDTLRCIETDELCTVWATSTTSKTLIKWSANNFGNYTAEQIGELFWIEPREAEPVAWDKPSASFDEWWDVNYEDLANPFEKDSAAWWAWAGWKAAQRPWVGLTNEEMSDIVADIDVDFGDLLWKVICLTKIIEATLKERNK